MTGSSEGHCVSVPGIAYCCTAASSAPFQPSLGRFSPSNLATQIISSGDQSHHSLHGSGLMLKKCPVSYLSHATQLLYQRGHLRCVE